MSGHSPHDQFEDGRSDAETPERICEAYGFRRVSDYNANLSNPVVVITGNSLPDASQVRRVVTEIDPNTQVFLDAVSGYDFAYALHMPATNQPAFWEEPENVRILGDLELERIRYTAMLAEFNLSGDDPSEPNQVSSGRFGKILARLGLVRPALTSMSPETKELVEKLRAVKTQIRRLKMSKLIMLVDTLRSSHMIDQALHRHTVIMAPSWLVMDMRFIDAMRGAHIAYIAVTADPPETEEQR